MHVIDKLNINTQHTRCSCCDLLINENASIVLYIRLFAKSGRQKDRQYRENIQERK